MSIDGVVRMLTSIGLQVLGMISGVHVGTQLYSQNKAVCYAVVHVLPLNGFWPLKRVFSL